VLRRSLLALAGWAAMMPCIGLANEPGSLITGSLPPAGEGSRPGRLIREPDAPPAGRLVVLGFAGDLGFSGSDQPLSPAGAIRRGRVIPWDDLISGVAPLLEADATFANLETVITERADLEPVEKAFNFAASPEGLAAAVKAGINVITAANNHAADYGEQGIAETLRHLGTAKAAGLKGYAGLGQGEARYLPGVFDLEGISVGVAAVGKGINPAGPAGFGQPLYASPSDFARASAALGGTKAEIRVLSVHYGEELGLIPPEADRAWLRAAVDRGEATIVFGHHSHVASGVERRGNAVIFYGLGNFLHAGTQAMARYGACRDFGLHARVYLWVAPGAAPVLRAVEVTPIADMHDVTRPYPPGEAAIRIGVVNAMNEELSGEGRDALRFVPTEAGTGLACFAGQGRYGDELAARCAASTGLLRTASLSEPMPLAACKPLPQVRVATAEPNATPAPAKPGAAEGNPKEVAVLPVAPAKKAVASKPPAGVKKKAKAARKFFLFSKAD